MIKYEQCNNIDKCKYGFDTSNKMAKQSFTENTYITRASSYAREINMFNHLQNGNNG